MSGVARDEGREQRYDDVLETMKRVHEKPDGTGSVKCARCFGTVRYEKRSERRTNRGKARKAGGKVWSRGNCETEGCIAWII